MIETATGLVLRTRPLTETSLIVHWVTPGLGRLATVAKGARRPKSTFRGKLDLFYLADFSFARSQRSELHNLREVSLRETHRRLRQDLSALQQASYCAALVEQSTETETPLPGVFDLLVSVMDRLEDAPARPETILGFEAKLLKELGMQPDYQRSALDAGTKQVLRTLTERDWRLIGTLKLSEMQITSLGRFLNGFLTYHLGKVPKGRSLVLQRPARESEPSRVAGALRA